MPYALFKDREQLSRAFPTKEETLRKACEAGLVEDDNGQPVLEQELEIKPCSPDSGPQDDEDLDWVPEKSTS
jgi:hypothetical protein